MADEDGGLAGSFLRESISRGPLGPMLAIQRVQQPEGRKRLAHGDGSALLIIPKGYDRAVMRDEAAQWTLVTNPEQQLMPRVVREVASAHVDAASYLQRIAGTQLRALGDAPEWRTAFRELGRGSRSVATYLDPPRITLKTTAVGDPAAPRRTGSPMVFPAVPGLGAPLVGAGLGREGWEGSRAGEVRGACPTPR